MDPLTRKDLEERIWKEVQIIMTEGDRTYLRGLPRTALVEALENELRFLGLYAYRDTETPEVIHALIEQHIDQWCMDYLGQQDVALLGAHPPILTTQVQIAASSLIQVTFTTGSGTLITNVLTGAVSGSLITEGICSIDFMPPTERSDIQKSPIPA